MKRLLLLRHAKSSWDAPVARDFERPLNRRGRRAGKQMGVYLRAQDIHWDITLSSPAARTRETVKRLRKGYGERFDTLFEESIYMASAPQLFKLIKGLDDSYDRIMVIGHNPGLQGLALMLTPNTADPARARIEAKYPTAALAVIDFSVNKWADLAAATGQLERFIKPKELPELP